MRTGKIPSWLLPHGVLIAFSATIVLPILWLLRVALTDKLTAYKIPPEWVKPRLTNFVEIFTGYPFFDYFVNSLTIALGATLIALPLATAMAYAFARYRTGGLPLQLSCCPARCCRQSSWYCHCLPCSSRLRC